MTIQGSGRMSGVEIRSGTYRPRRRGPSTLRGLLIVGLLGAVVLTGAALVIGPAFRDFARGLARDNPQTLTWPFVADVVKADLGASLTTAAGTDPTPISFSVTDGQTTSQIAQSLADAHLISDPLVYEYLVINGGVDGKNQVGSFDLNTTMTPKQIVDRLQEPPVPPPSTVVIGGARGLRAGLRIEQITALLQCGVQDADGHCQNPPVPYALIDAQSFEHMATDKTIIDGLRPTYPWMAAIPESDSETLEGFLGSGTFEVPLTTTTDQFLGILLDKWTSDMGAVFAETPSKGRTFYDVMKLASLVEREAKLDADRGKIAGVYQNRLDGLNGPKLLNSEPTVIYAVDTDALAKMSINAWPNYVFWSLTGVENLATVPVSAPLASFQTWSSTGLTAWPITSPSLASIQAAMNPDQKGGYLYFLAKCDNSGGTWFEKTLADHNTHIAQCAAKP